MQKYDPIAALYEAIKIAIMCAYPRNPSAAIERLPESIRKQLRELKSDDCAKMRIK